MEHTEYESSCFGKESERAVSAETFGESSDFGIDFTHNRMGV
jgi:hypothetical protein